MAKEPELFHELDVYDFENEQVSPNGDRVPRRGNKYKEFMHKFLPSFRLRFPFLPDELLRFRCRTAWLKFAEQTGLIRHNKPADRKQGKKRAKSSPFVKKDRRVSFHESVRVIEPSPVETKRPSFRSPRRQSLPVRMPSVELEQSPPVQQQASTAAVFDYIDEVHDEPEPIEPRKAALVTAKSDLIEMQRRASAPVFSSKLIRLETRKAMLQIAESPLVKMERRDKSVKETPKTTQYKTPFPVVKKPKTYSRNKRYFLKQ